MKHFYGYYVVFIPQIHFCGCIFPSIFSPMTVVFIMSRALWNETLASKLSRDLFL